MKVAWILVGFLAAALALGRPEPNAFLNRPARTVGQLVRQVRSDPEVRDRFQRHYHLTFRELTEFLSGLRVARLERDGLYPVFNCRPDGVIRYRLLRLRRGTLVFADRHGRPVLKLLCGNPIGAVPQDALLGSEPRPWVGGETSELRTVGDQLAAPDAAEDLYLAELSPPEAPAIDVVGGESPAEILEPGLPILSGGGPGGIPVWPFLPPIVPLPDGGGGGGEPIGPPVIAEPSTLGLAAAAAAAWLWRRRSRT
ncbi:MAG: DUF6777 domain-containing protein [Fimbriimonadales bacterium]